LKIWFQALQLLVPGKRGISALELQRVLKIGSYQTAWVDDNGKPRPRAGFAKIALASETKQDAQSFVNQTI